MTPQDLNISRDKPSIVQKFTELQRVRPGAAVVVERLIDGLIAEKDKWQVPS